MTKKPLTTSEIIGQKIDHIKFFSDDDTHEAFLRSIAQDACYTANNSVNYKKKLLADALAEYDDHKAKGNELSAEKTKAYAGRLQAETEILIERLEIEKAVFFTITGGEEWTPYKPKAPAKKRNVDMEAIRKLVGA